MALEFGCAHYNLGYSREMPCMTCDAQRWKAKHPLLPDAHWGATAWNCTDTGSESIPSQLERMQPRSGLPSSHSESLHLIFTPPSKLS